MKKKDQLDRLRDEHEAALRGELLLRQDVISDNERLRSQLADARELLRKAIPHLVGNNHWDGVARIRAHLESTEAEKSEVTRRP